MAVLHVILDASVIFPAALRDTLLRAAAANLYQLYWTEEILEEVRRNLVVTGRANEQQAGRLLDVMRKAFPDAFVTDYLDLVHHMRNDPKDRHVLAAAVARQAQVIITSNLRDFPPQALEPYQISAQSPDQFLLHLFDRAAAEMVQLVTDQASDLRSPPRTLDYVLSSLSKQAPLFVQRIREELGIPPHDHANPERIL